MDDMQRYIQMLIQRLWEVEDELEKVDEEEKVKELRDEQRELREEIEALQGTLFPRTDEPQAETSVGDGVEGEEDEEEPWIV